MTDRCDSATDEERLVAMLAHLLTIPAYGGVLLQYLIPLVIYFVYREKSPFVAFHALQSLFFQLAILGIIASIGLIVVLTLGLGIVVVIPLLIIVPVCGIVFPIIAGVKSYGGQWYEYPFVGAAARRTCTT
jgi:hypothetical protein